MPVGLRQSFACVFAFSRSILKYASNALSCAWFGSGRAAGVASKIIAFCADAEASQKFSRMLWTAPALSFIPHCTADDKLAPVTPVIVDHAGANPIHDDVLINLRTERPPFFSRFQRLVEIVTLDEEDRELARDRFKF